MENISMKYARAGKLAKQISNNIYDIIWDMEREEIDELECLGLIKNVMENYAKKIKKEYKLK